MLNCFKHLTNIGSLLVLFSYRRIFSPRFLGKLNGFSAMSHPTLKHQNMKRKRVSSAGTLAFAALLMRLKYFPPASYLFVCFLAFLCQKSWGSPNVEWEGSVGNRWPTAVNNVIQSAVLLASAAATFRLSGISIMEFVKSWRLLQLKVTLTLNS